MDMLSNLIKMSNKYGSSEEYVLAGGGNTSVKSDNIMYVKGSGTSLATITESCFVKMDVAKLREMLEKSYPESDNEREALALTDMMNARMPGEENKRPSVEAILHAIFPYTYVLHLHPALVNGLTCSKGGEALCNKLLGEEALWIGLIKPGYILGRHCNEEFKKYTLRTGKQAQVVVLQNHGIFIAADTTEEIDNILHGVMKKLGAQVQVKPNLEPAAIDADKACRIAPAIRMLYGKGKASTVVFCAPAELADFYASESAMQSLLKPFTPDHIVYCKASPLYLADEQDIDVKFAQFTQQNGYMPKIVVVKDLGFFAVGMSKKEAEIARIVFIDAIKIASYSKYFAAALTLPEEFISFILGWEVENYRQKQALSSDSNKRMDKKVCVVTGAAQGFGKGIAENLAKQGAYVVIADMNYQGATACAAEINAAHTPESAFAAAVNVCDEASVAQMCREAVLAYGGIDVLVSNAGIVISGAISEMSKEGFEKVTAVNYTGYFLCTKHISEVMKIQHKYAPDYLMDIIEINSKSGLEGSNKNFAYAGSKFGGIGLTQSFAMELIEYGIKVNAVCPGNLLDGPLWSDPEKGLFKQYLDAGKVPGAKTIADVRSFYENKVPMKRGCTVLDVARAILYICEQEYEIGQAVPVTGGQVMLK